MAQENQWIPFSAITGSGKDALQGSDGNDMQAGLPDAGYTVGPVIQ